MFGFASCRLWLSPLHSKLKRGIEECVWLLMASAVRKDHLFGGILQFCLSYSLRFFFGSCFHSRPIEWEWVLRLDALRHSPLWRFPFRGNNPPGNLWVEALTPEFLDFMSGSSDVRSADLDLLYDFTARPAPCSRLGWIGDWCLLLGCIRLARGHETYIL